jgi:hypothetical protein
MFVITLIGPGHALVLVAIIIITTMDVVKVIKLQQPHLLMFVTVITVMVLVAIIIIAIMDVVKVIKLQQPNIHIPLLQQQLHPLMFVITLIGRGHAPVLVVIIIITIMDVV